MHKTELVQEEKEQNRYENLCASRVQEGVYIEECDYGEIKGQQWGQEDHEDDTHHHHHSLTNKNEESTQAMQKSDRPEYGNIMWSHPDDQSQATSHQQSVLPQDKLAVDKHKSHQSAPPAEQQMPREGMYHAYDVDEELYDDIQPQQRRGKGQCDPCHPEAMEGCTENKLDCQSDYDYTAMPQSSAAGSGTTRYQPLLSRESDYENNLEDYNSINASQQRDDRGSDGEYVYVATKPRYYYRPSVK